MDFQSVNTLNVRLNKISGNLLPLTADDLSFSVFWRVYSVLVWLLEAAQISILIPGCILVPKEKALKDGLIGIVVSIEVVFIIMRVHTHRGLVQRFIRVINDTMRSRDKMMRDIVTATIKSMEIPLKFYWSAGCASIIIWSSTPFVLIFERDLFYYVDYRMPVAFTGEPFSSIAFVAGSVIVMTSSAYIFTKKVGVDTYMIHLILLVTAQYRYITLKLPTIFARPQNSHGAYDFDEKGHYSKMVEQNLKTLCQHYNIVLQISLMLKELLSLNFSLIYINSILRFSFIAIMVLAIPSTTLLEALMIIMYAVGGIVQLYILCSCVQQLLDATIEITDKAFYEEWYRYGMSVKRIFMLMILANNLECKLSTVEKFNLSLPSFMAILNQSYSIALLLVKTS